MTLQLSGAISANDINVELGRAANAPFSLTGSEERALAGILSGTISFSDFYGKSSATEFTSMVTLEYDFAGFGYYTFRAYGVPKGSASPVRLNGLKLFSFGEGESGFSANLSFSGRYAAFELNRVVIETDGQGNTIDQIVTIPDLKSTTLVGLGIPSYQKTNATTPFTLKMYFSAEYLHGFSLTSASDSGNIGYVHTFYGAVRNESPRDFVFNGNTYNIYGITTIGSNSQVRLTITKSGSPNMTQNSFSKIRYVSPSYFDFGTSQVVPEHVVELETSASTFGSDATYNYWTWTISNGIQGGRSYDLVIIK